MSIVAACCFLLLGVYNEHMPRHSGRHVLFTAWRQSDAGHIKLICELRLRCRSDGDVGPGRLRITWFATREDRGWMSCGGVDMEGATLDEIRVWSGLLARAGYGGDTSPADLFAGLERHGARQGAYSGSRRRWMPVDELPPAGEAAYRDIQPGGGCAVHAYLPAESDATRIHTAVRDALVAEGRGAALEAWLGAGARTALVEVQDPHPQPWRHLIAAPALATVA